MIELLVLRGTETKTGVRNAKSKKVAKPDFWKKKISKFFWKFFEFGQIGPKFEIFGQLFKFESLTFSELAYSNGQAWCLSYNGGPVAKKFRAKLGHNLDLSPN